jgi:hypothetical protein
VTPGTEWKRLDTDRHHLGRGSRSKGEREPFRRRSI